MGRIMAIDYGTRRVGIAVTDPLQIIAHALTTVETKNIFEFIANYFKTEQVDKVLIGYPLNSRGEPTDATPHIDKFMDQFRKQFPQMELLPRDEAFTSKMAMQSIIASGVKKKDRRDKSLIDQVSATIILQEYLQNL
jgi:putative Holliday junction resolvase